MITSRDINCVEKIVVYYESLDPFSLVKGADWSIVSNKLDRMDIDDLQSLYKLIERYKRSNAMRDLIIDYINDKIYEGHDIY